MKLILKRKRIWLLFALFVCAAALLPATRVPAAAEESVARVGSRIYADFNAALSNWGEGETLTLLKDVHLPKKLSVNGAKTLDLNGKELQGVQSDRVIVVQEGADFTISDSLNSGKITGGRGVLIEGGATLYMRGGTITGNSGGENGTVVVSEGATFQMSGGNVIGNETDSVCGGVYAAGYVTLSGSATIFENIGRNRASNLYLNEGKLIQLENFSGKVGISMKKKVGKFASTSADTGTFLADDLSYAVSTANGESKLELSPVKNVKAEWVDDMPEIYPGTSLEEVKQYLMLTAFNQNDRPYAGEFHDVRLEGELTLGKCSLTVYVKDEANNQVKSTISLTVGRPKLIEISAQYQPQTPIYFNSSWAEVGKNVAVQGTYSDGITRAIFQSAEQTAEENKENYLTDYYTLSGDLNDRAGDTAVVKVHVGQRQQEIALTVSRYALIASKITVESVSITQSEELPENAFTPALPQGLAAEITLNGSALQASSLQAGVYTVEISFQTLDTRNYEPVEGKRNSTLTVKHESLNGVENGKQTEINFSCEAGISPRWEFEVRNVKAGSSINGLKIGQAAEITLKVDGIAQNPDEKVTVRMALNEKMKKEKVSLYRILSDGTAIQVDADLQDDCFVFQTQELIKTQYIVAYEESNAAYIWLTVLFGVLCLGGAAALIWYFAVRRKMT